MPKPALGSALPARPEEATAELLEAAAPPCERGGGGRAAAAWADFPEQRGPSPRSWQAHAELSPEGGGGGAGGVGGHCSRGSGGDLLHLRHVLVDRLLDDQTLGLLLQGTSIVGFCSSEAEDSGWLIGDQIVEINGQRVGAFEEFIDRFKEAQEQGFPIDFSVLRCELASQEGAGGHQDAQEALEGFFGARDLMDIAGLMQRKFGSSRELRDSLSPTSALYMEGEDQLGETITDNPYIQALRKRREDLSRTAEGWVVDAGCEPLAVQLATQSSGGLATLTVAPEARRGEQSMGWAGGCAEGAGARPCAAAGFASLNSADIQPTPRVDLDTAVNGCAAELAAQESPLALGKGPM